MDYRKCAAILIGCWGIAAVLAPMPARAQTNSFNAEAVLCLSHVDYCESERSSAPGAIKFKRRSDWNFPGQNASGSQSGHTTVKADYGSVSLESVTSIDGTAVGEGGFSIEGHASAAIDYFDTLRVSSPVLDWGTPVSIRLDSYISHFVKGVQNASGNGDVYARADRFLTSFVEVRGLDGLPLLSEVLCTDPYSRIPWPCTRMLEKKGEQTISYMFEAHVGDELVVVAWFLDDAYAVAWCFAQLGENCSSGATASVKGIVGRARQDIRVTPLLPEVTLTSTSGHDWTSWAKPVRP